MTTQQDVPTTWNRHDVKKHFNISESTFWKWLKAGRLQGFYVGSQIRFRPEDIQRMEQQGREQFEAKWGQPGPDDAQKEGVANG